jgi:outer membrane protein OmpA-like peptidoglycan-associated protein
MSEESYLSGFFSGEFYTQQGSSDYIDQLKARSKNDIRIIKGTVSGVSETEEFPDPKVQASNFLFDYDVSSVLVEEFNGQGAVNFLQREFSCISLGNINILSSHEINGKTYGKIEAAFIGELAPGVHKRPKEAKSFLDLKSNYLSWSLIILSVILLGFLLNECSKRKILDRDLSNKTEVIDSLNTRIENCIAEGEIKCLTKKLFFFSSTTNLRSESLPALLELSEKLSSLPNKSILIEGHVNGDPNSDFDGDGLDIKRANKVKAELVARGINEDKINTIGMGSRFPIVKETDRTQDEQGRSFNSNMRVEIKILD